MTPLEKAELRKAIHNAKFYDLMQEWRFIKVSEMERAGKVYSKIIDDIVVSVSSIIDEQVKKGSNHVKAQ